MQNSAADCVYLTVCVSVQRSTCFATRRTRNVCSPTCSSTTTTQSHEEERLLAYLFLDYDPVARAVVDVQRTVVVAVDFVLLRIHGLVSITSCCRTDRKRPHHCCHLPSKVENIDRMLGVTILYSGSEPGRRPRKCQGKPPWKIFRSRSYHSVVICPGHRAPPVNKPGEWR